MTDKDIRLSEAKARLKLSAFSCMYMFSNKDLSEYERYFLHAQSKLFNEVEKFNQRTIEESAISFFEKEVGKDNNFFINLYNLGHCDSILSILCDNKLSFTYKQLILSKGWIRFCLRSSNCFDGDESDDDIFWITGM